MNHLIVGFVRQEKLVVGKAVHTKDVYIMRNQKKNLLSKSAIQALQLLKPAATVYAVELSSDVKKEFPELFKGLGMLKDVYKIPLKEDATPVCLYTPRRVAHPLLPKVKKQLEKMETAGVISAVTEPTEWCSGMVVVPKPSGEIRVCVDLTLTTTSRRFAEARYSRSSMQNLGFGRFLCTQNRDYSPHS